MCGRFGLFSPANVVAEWFDLREIPAIEPRFNIAPSQSILAVCRKTTGRDRVAVFFSWGLIPRWATRSDFKLINARCETVAEKPAFRQAIQRRRCLVPADGFFEWRKRGRDKQPYFFRMKDRTPFGMAGIYEQWEHPTGQRLTTCALVTTRANDLLRPIHDRMPVIVPRSHFDVWLDTKGQVELSPLFAPYDAGAMEGYRVSRAVNAASVDHDACVAPIDPAQDGSEERGLFD